MSSITGSSLGQNALSKRSYIATAVFNAYFYSYNSTINNSNQRIYTLAVNPLANASNCKAGHILTENGRKLVPGANTDSANLLRTYMVGVYDPSSGLSGFIDPNSSVFAPYNTNLPNFIARAGEPNTTTAPDGSTNDMGPSVFTSGTVTAAGQIRCTTVTVLGTGATVNINPALSQVFTLAQASGQAMTITATASQPAGSLVYLVVTPAGTAALITWGANIKGANNTPTAGKTTTFSFVSDGTNLNMFGSVTSS
jgi:hypothetical protein